MYQILFKITVICQLTNKLDVTFLRHTVLLACFLNYLQLTC